MEIPYVVQPREDTGLYNAKVGIWLFLASEVMLFGALFSSYILLRIGAPEGTWPNRLLNVPIGTANTVVLITSSITVLMAWASLKMNNFARYRVYQAFTILLAMTFVCIKSYEYHDKFTHYEAILKDGRVVDGHIVKSKSDTNVVTLLGHYVDKTPAKAEHKPAAEKPKEGAAAAEPAHHTEITLQRKEIKKLENYGPWHNTYLAIYFTLSGLHALHVIAGAFVIGMIWGPGAKMWKTDPERYTNRVEVSGLFWHFVDLVWIFLFPVLYLL